MSQCSSYRMDSVPCTVPAAHNHQLRSSEKQHNSLYSNNTTIKHAAHTMRERKREDKKEGGRERKREEGRGGREGEREGRREGRRGGEGGREGGKKGRRERGRD